MPRTSYPSRFARLLVSGGLLLCLAGCQTIGTFNSSPFSGPSNQRDWAPPHSVVPTAKMRGDQVVKVYHVRNFRYASPEVYVPAFEDRVYDLNELQTVDFIVSPFNGHPDLAHTMLSFGFRGGDQLAVSVEARLENGESYSPLRGALNQYELIYVLADERDVIPLRTEARQSDVYVYRTNATPEEVRSLFQDIVQRVNHLANQPEYYHSLTNNCTTNIRDHVNRLRPGKIPWDLRVVLPGRSDQLAYDLGLIDRSLPFDQVRRLAKVNDRVAPALKLADFSQQIRR
ncbi:MAG: DUF4105 domain-containing protein [Pirellulaceae bacterium]|nr:DUF4105 domain-containing protein [Planctomycetales bacterium]